MNQPWPSDISRAHGGLPLLGVIAREAVIATRTAVNATGDVVE
jgi:hypothetical protein